MTLSIDWDNYELIGDTDSASVESVLDLQDVVVDEINRIYENDLIPPYALQQLLIELERLELDNDR